MDAQLEVGRTRGKCGAADHELAVLVQDGGIHALSRRIEQFHGAAGGAIDPAADRERGFRRALEMRGIAVDPGLISSGAMIEASGLSQAKRLLELPKDRRPTAFVCSSIGVAIGVKRACAAQGLGIGKDIALIAHDDRIHDMGAESFDPPLTATQSSIGDAGRRIVELCVGMLREPQAPLPSEVWPVDLVVRGSTMPVG